jgi:hypothetical protein
MNGNRTLLRQMPFRPRPCDIRLQIQVDNGQLSSRVRRNGVRWPRQIELCVVCWNWFNQILWPGCMAVLADINSWPIRCVRNRFWFCWIDDGLNIAVRQPLTFVVKTFLNTQNIHDTVQELSLYDRAENILTYLLQKAGLILPTNSCWLGLVASFWKPTVTSLSLLTAYVRQTARQHKCTFISIDYWPSGISRPNIFVLSYIKSLRLWYSL